MRINLKDNIWIFGLDVITRTNIQTTEVDFYPDDGFPLCVGYMIGKDDGESTLYTDRIKAIQSACIQEYCIIYKL